MIELRQIKINVKDAPSDEKAHLLNYTCEKLNISRDAVRKFEIHKRSLDARKKPDLFYVYSVRFLSDDEQGIIDKNKRNKNISIVSKPILYESKLKHVNKTDGDIVIVGSGPCGLFAAYALCLRGLKPIVIERGAEMDERVAEVEKFWETGELNTECNVCFGEGGAGTFSDGKLNSGVKDSDGAKRFILETFVRFGASYDILYDSKPHIGTDVLRSVVKNMRHAMERQGVTFLFNTVFTGLEKKDDRVSGVFVRQGEEKKTIACKHVILAIGHSARDTFAALNSQRIKITPKPFAVGVRVQHTQSLIDMSQYETSDVIPAYYKLTGKTSDGKGVYTFCMCPGGYVVNASSEKGCLVVNGMSDVARDSGYANSAIVVTVDPSDGDENADNMIGVNYQRELENKMYNVLDGKIPVQRYESFHDKNNDVKARMHPLSDNQPSVKGQWEYADVAAALPDDIHKAVCEAIDQFGKKIKDFDKKDTLILGLESRTSSPVRIVRDPETYESVSLPGLYPSGEGAGYAGGILSAAMDGLKVSEKLVVAINSQI